MTATPELSWSAIGSLINVTVLITAILAFRASAQAVKYAQAQADAAKEQTQLLKSELEDAKAEEERLLQPQIVPYLKWPDDGIFVMIANASHYSIRLDNCDIYRVNPKGEFVLMDESNPDRGEYLLNFAGRPVIASNRDELYYTVSEWSKRSATYLTTLKFVQDFTYMGPGLKRYQMTLIIRVIGSNVSLEESFKDLASQT